MQSGFSQLRPEALDDAYDQTAYAPNRDQVLAAGKPMELVYADGYNQAARYWAR